MSVAETGGTDAAERVLPFPCDRDLVVTYLIVPLEADCCRLLVKMVVRYPSGFRGALMRWGLPWSDLVMMRHQLLNLKALAER
jgi:hypothetical protein